MIHYWICGGFDSFHLTWMTGNYWREELASSNMWIGNDRHTVQPTRITYHKVTDNWWHSPKKRPMISYDWVSHLPGMHLPVPTCRTCCSLPLVWWIRHVQCSTISCPTCGFNTDHCKAVWDMDLPWPGEFAILIFIEHHFKESLESVAIHGQIFT